MDKEVNDFFNINKDIEHNKDALAVPTEFANAQTDEEITKFFKWIRHQSKCKSLKLTTVSVDELKEEIRPKIPLAVTHRENPGWRSITLYGYSSIMTNSYEHYKELGIVTDDMTTDWTDISRIFPKTVAWIKKNSPLKEFNRIRLMILDPDSSSTVHKDYELGQALCGPINAAIINPPGAEFVLENGGLVPWKEGEFRSMDVGSLHCIRNTGTEPRVHIIIGPIKSDWDIDAMRLACSSYIKERHDTRRT
jgi:hypothetical protein